MLRKPAAAVSLAIHVLVAILLFTITFPNATPPLLREAVHIFAPPRLPPISKNDAGGGGQRQPLPARRGRAPEPTVAKVFVPPMVVKPEAPKLVVIEALAETPAFNIAAPDVGNPNALSGLFSGGSGGPAGIGDHGCCGIGNKDGSRLDRPGSKPGSSSLKLTRDPQLIYKEEPEYSEEARKARQQGTVLLAIDVDTSGRAVNIRVIRSLGLGLDEKAKESVSHWKFKPGLVGDRPVISPATVAVTFHLL